MTLVKLTATALALAAVSATAATARDQIRIVGSSTVFPFSTAVAEQFGKTTDFATPVVESTGSGGGLKLFCSGVGTEHPDITNASRRMKEKEFKLCADNGVTEVTEAVVGFDGIVVANSKDGPRFELTRAQLVEALAANGPLPTNWSEIDPSLPAIKIEVLGPPPSSGTRDAFEELVMHEGCEDTDKVECEGVTVREDGVYVEAGENDNLIVSKLEANPNALGIFGFSFLDQNADKIQGAVVDGVEPTFENIADGEYPVSRSLYFYIKNAHVGVVPGLQEYANEFLSDAASGEEGYLIDKGLIPLAEDKHDEIADNVANLTPMTGNEWQ
ncbi:phosphate ABC transporter substrate-binding protein [Brevirhabdus pacifica]|uniref:Phosphate ABC transporter substrate-binding protein n=1 Tax=Brevirhabdus pacifica TaxID=1267768 RepID=A0A1U7DFA1_9RHOB|nr:PstS family phosphate ABC transporter substrate-binding protein [Brevirhabdus pacifica]APX88573.1 phosphate ABC transporter substrate-binding protein [Brevirhabdus pacifica]OWU79862.1 phosphate ABC transporter substrate-binding protein [Loktanella sp. 22II-4b]PJJ86938.1 phosphate ABC transporter substrate-binding protein (PhoT family) [Brevirhabdus pacifica]